MKLILVSITLIILSYSFFHYELNEDEINAAKDVTFLTIDHLNETLPKSITGYNAFGMSKEFTVDYTIEGVRTVDRWDKIVELERNFSARGLPSHKVKISIEINSGKKHVIETRINLTKAEFEYFLDKTYIYTNAIEKNNFRTYNFNEKIFDILPSSVCEGNYFGEYKSYSVTYKLDGKTISKDDLLSVIDAYGGKEGITNDYKPVDDKEDRLPNLINDLAVLEYSIGDKEFKKLVLKIGYKDIKIKPLIIDREYNPEGYVAEATSLGGSKQIKFVINPSREDLAVISDLNKPMEKYYINETEDLSIVLLNREYIDITDKDYREIVFGDDSLDVLENSKQGLIEGMEVIPLDLMKVAVFSGLITVAEDFKELDGYEIGNDFREADYLTAGGSYSPSKNIININTHADRFVMSSIRENLSENYFYNINLNPYTMKLYNVNSNIWKLTSTDLLQKYLNYEYRNLYIHEFMHFLDFRYRLSKNEGYDESDYMPDYWFDTDTMERLRPVVNELGYGYEGNYCYEFLAYSAEAFFLMPEYLKEKAPEIYDVIELIINATTFDVVEEFNQLVSMASNRSVWVLE